jgi:hypothetical protein
MTFGLLPKKGGEPEKKNIAILRVKTIVNYRIWECPIMRQTQDVHPYWGDDPK